MREGAGDRVPGHQRQDQPEPALLQHAARASRPIPSAPAARRPPSPCGTPLAEAERAARIFSGLQPRDLAALERVGSVRAAVGSGRRARSPRPPPFPPGRRGQ